MLSGRTPRSRGFLQDWFPYRPRVTIAAGDRQDGPAAAARPDEAQAGQDAFDDRPQPGRGFAELLGERPEVAGVDASHDRVDLHAGEHDPSGLVRAAFGGRGVENLER